MGVQSVQFRVKGIMGAQCLVSRRGYGRAVLSFVKGLWARSAWFREGVMGAKCLVS